MMKLYLTTAALLLLSISHKKETYEVCVIDSGVDMEDVRIKPHLCSSGHVNLTKSSMSEDFSHGNHVVGIIISNSPKSGYCLKIIKFYSETNTEKQNNDNMIRALEISSSSCSLVNVSAGGSNADEKEHRVIKESKATFVLAAGNNGIELSKHPSYYPAGYFTSNSVVVGNLNKDGTIASTSNRDSRLVWEVGEWVESFGYRGSKVVMSGTSMAAARRTARIITDTVRRTNGKK